MTEKDIYQIRLESVETNQVPGIIENQIGKMEELKKRIEDASNKAFDAKEAVINETAPQTLSKRAAIDSLQSATLDLANAQEAAMKAQKLQFEYQQALADTTKFLFCLGLTNIAMNRVVVEELELRLRNAAQNELDDLARAEIENLIKRLKMQQDIDQKQTELKKLLKEQLETNDNQTKEIKEQAEKDEEHDRRIDELYSIIAKQNQIIDRVLIEMGEMRKELFKCNEEIAVLKTGLSYAPGQSIGQLYADDNSVSSLSSSGDTFSTSVSSTSCSTNVSIGIGDSSTHMNLPTPDDFDPTDTVGSSH